MPDQPIQTTQPQTQPQTEPQHNRAIAAPAPLTQRQVPPQRWQIFPAQPEQAQAIAQATALSPLLAQVLINRGIHTPEQAWAFLDPETLLLPSPIDEFPDLGKSLDLLVAAIETQQQILICGDYDADGMTSTALLMRSLRYLGAQVDYAIPSRMDEGYGINKRIVEDFHALGGSIILTVDNGIAAYDPIARARELGLSVILTDHHAVPENIPPANAILNPQLIDATSPYRGVAGVGVAYILAVSLAQRMDQMQDLTATLLALFTLGTIADLAPLTGVNRRWVKRGLKHLPKSRIPGIQALIEVAGLSEETALKPEAIGFRLGPRINAVGRIADPQIVIDLLTTDDIGVALQRAMQCEEANQLRRQMCEVIEQQAVEWCEAQMDKGLLNLQTERVLVVVQPEWHHGVIGIVASRLVERYGVPVFIGTYEDKTQQEIRGSARSIPEFNVVEALRFCDDLLDKYGGHRAAGGFSFPANKLQHVKSRLSNFASQHLQPEHLKPLVTADVQAQLIEADLALYTQIDQIHPCGIENPDPVFWTANVTVVEQKVIGKTSAHLKLTLAHTPPLHHPGNREKAVMKAIAWRWGTYYPLPKELDIAYKLRLNAWNGRRDVELELVGVRPSTPTHPIETPTHPIEKGIQSWPATPHQGAIAPALHVEFYYSQRHYKGTLKPTGRDRQLILQNPEAHRLVVHISEQKGVLYLPEKAPQLIDITELKYFNLIQAGLSALEIKQKTQLLSQKDELLAEKDRQIHTMKAQIGLLEEKITQLSAEQQQQFAELKTEWQSQENAIHRQKARIEQLQIQGNHTPLSTPAEIQQQAQETVGDGVWCCLQASSRKDFQTAYKNDQIARASSLDTQIADYSKAGIHLSDAIEREVMAPFFEGLCDFAKAQSQPTLGNLPLHPTHPYTLCMMPALLADQWRAFAPDELTQPSLASADVKIVRVKAHPQMTASDRTFLNQFFAQWEHPMAVCLSTKSRQAASSLDQISKLRNIATHPESFLYRWQYELLHQLIAGKDQKGGLLRQIFS